MCSNNIIIKINASGQSTLKTTIINGDTLINGIDVSNNITTNNNLIVDGNISVDGNADINGNATYNLMYLIILYLTIHNYKFN